MIARSETGATGRHGGRRSKGGLVLTERDLAIFRDLHDNRFLTTRQLQRLHGARVRHRLTRLARARYVDRPAAQWVWRRREGGGSRPIVYALGHRGAKALAAAGLTRALARDWTERNRTLSAWSFLVPHELAVADIRVAFRRACAGVPGLLLLQADELTGGSGARGLEVPGRDRPLYPDWIFALALEGATRSEPCLFFVEVDRCTEPNVRHGSPERQSLARKYEGYLAFARARGQLDQFGVRNFRVLTVTTGGPAKVMNLAQAAFAVSGGRGAERFLATSAAALAEQDVLSVPWVNGAGQVSRLIV